jgi:hypothetical protein
MICLRLCLALCMWPSVTCWASRHCCFRGPWAVAALLGWAVAALFQHCWAGHSLRTPATSGHRGIAGLLQRTADTAADTAAAKPARTHFTSLCHACAKPRFSKYALLRLCCFSRYVVKRQGSANVDSEGGRNLRQPHPVMLCSFQERRRARRPLPARHTPPRSTDRGCCVCWFPCRRNKTAQQAIVRDARAQTKCYYCTAPL